MKYIELKKIDHNIKVGMTTPDIVPNINEDCYFVEDGKIIGFYLTSLTEKASKLADIANKEFLSDNVSKDNLQRSSGVMKAHELGLERQNEYSVEQMSTIFGSIPKKVHMKRYNHRRAQIHGEPKSRTFLKALYKLALESEKIIKDVCPEIYENQLKLLEQVDEKWRFGNLFTSGICNFNIPAPYHQDNANLKGTCNVIITKRQNSKGGNLHIPDYDATINQKDNSILVYPAWRNIHGVTPINPTFEGGYRNSLVFYSLNAFTK